MNEQIINEFNLKTYWLNIVLPVAFLIILLISGPDPLYALKGFIFSVIMLYAANSDIETMEVPDSVHVMILITALIGVAKENILSMLLGFVLIPLPLFVAAVIKQNSIGGADIKLMAASAFLLGFEKALVALIIGSVLAVICTCLVRNIKNQSSKTVFPLVPYLGIGCFIAYL